MKLTDNVLEIRDLVKDFPSVRAVNDVSFDIKRNTVHCLVGENGAGKSTLIKILTGAYARTGGTDPAERGGVRAAQPPRGQAEGHQHPVPGAQRRRPAHRRREPHPGHGGHDVRLPAEDRQDQHDGQRDEQPRAVHQPAPAGLDASAWPRSRSWRSPRRWPRSPTSSSWTSRRPRSPRARSRGCSDHQGPAREERHRHLHLPPARRDLRARRLRHGDARRQAHRHQARRRR